MVYYPTVCLVNNNLCNFVYGLLRSHVIFIPSGICIFSREHWILFKFAKRIKSWSLRCLLQYYGWEIYHSKLRTVRITLRFWMMKVRFTAYVSWLLMDYLNLVLFLYASSVSLNSQSKLGLAWIFCNAICCTEPNYVLFCIMYSRILKWFSLTN